MSVSSVLTAIQSEFDACERLLIGVAALVRSVLCFFDDALEGRTQFTHIKAQSCRL